MIEVQGFRVYLELPEKKETGIHLSKEVSEEIQREYVAKLNKLKIAYIGESVTNFNVGDEVFVDPDALKRAFFIEIEGKENLIVSSHHISHKW